MAKQDQNDQSTDKEQDDVTESRQVQTVPLAEYNELKERMMRIAADFDNYKKRTKNESDAAHMMGKAELLVGMLPVIDEFELAMIAIGRSTDRETLHGIELLYANLLEMLKKQGLKQIEADSVFDPNKHEIVMAVPSKQKPGTIVDVVKRGYMFGSMLLRPSSVIVAKDGEAESPSDQK